MSRIYLVPTKSGADHHLVKANSAAQAERFVAKQVFLPAVVANQDDLVRLIQQGAYVQDATSAAEVQP